MAENCGFSTGFGSGFSVCAPVAEPPAVARGIPAPLRQRFRRLRADERAGLGLIVIVGTGELTILRGVGSIRITGAGAMEADDELTVLGLLGLSDEAGF